MVMAALSIVAGPTTTASARLTVAALTTTVANNAKAIDLLCMRPLLR
jgi:hypothetical protein